MGSDVIRWAEMERAARKRDPRWDDDPPINRALYYKGYEDGFRAGRSSAQRDEGEQKKLDPATVMTWVGEP